ncbi:hypothetical protein SKAU_G00017550 [Synaphobranchus kaupii]|uniref:Uncharacterized protein n=1 Tax=Synaphobranchus kaupii TaxID=118154 RepID=A0A9Q1GBI1_SYNKA|nr:hypothetical protein SKAU_G00017550 [Synaphobranchus kaupii]
MVTLHFLVSVVKPQPWKEVTTSMQPKRCATVAPVASPVLLCRPRVVYQSRPSHAESLNGGVRGRDSLSLEGERLSLVRSGICTGLSLPGLSPGLETVKAAISVTLLALVFSPNEEDPAAAWLVGGERPPFWKMTIPRDTEARLHLHAGYPLSFIMLTTLEIFEYSVPAKHELWRLWALLLPRENAEFHFSRQSARLTLKERPFRYADSSQIHFSGMGFGFICLGV